MEDINNELNKVINLILENKLENPFTFRYTWIDKDGLNHEIVIDIAHKTMV